MTEKPAHEGAACSLVTRRDAETASLVADLTGTAPAEGAIPFAGLPGGLREAGYIGESARLASCVANESILSTAVGEWVREAAESGQLELMFDLSVGELTQSLAQQLQAAAGGEV